MLEAKHEDLTTYTETTEQLDQAGFDSRAGYGPVTWGAWEDNWTGWDSGGSSSSQGWRGDELVKTTTTTQTRTGTSSRTAKENYKEKPLVQLMKVLR